MNVLQQHSALVAAIEVASQLIVLSVALCLGDCAPKDLFIALLNLNSSVLSACTQYARI